MHESDSLAARKHSNRHYRKLDVSEWCGSFFYLAIFPPEDIERWLDVGSASGYPRTQDFLRQMHQH